MEIRDLVRIGSIGALSMLFLTILASCSGAGEAEQDDRSDASGSQSEPTEIYNNSVAVLEDNLIRLSVDDGMNIAIHAIKSGSDTLVIPMGPAFGVRLAGGEVVDSFKVENVERSPVSNELGGGVSFVISATASDMLSVDLNLGLYQDFPGVVVSSVTYTNSSEEPLGIESWVNNSLSLPAQETKDDVKFWAFQGSSHIDRRDWVTPLSNGYTQQNYMGMNASDYGGGTPVVDVWRKDAGIAIGHIEPNPKLVSLPVSVENDYAHISVEYESLTELAPGEKLSTFDTFVSVHQRDYYPSLKSYSHIMARRGLEQPKFPDSSYEAIWCAWGYERGFDVEEVLATLPKAKSMGLEWAVLDDGWQTAEGDWYLNPEKFPRGDADMIAFVDEINAAGMKAKLWWAPLAVDPGTDLLHDNTDMLLLNEWGAVHDVSWWNSFYLCPAYEPTVEHSKRLVRTIMQKWGYAGLKIDGQHLNSVAPCYNPAHNHERPEESVEAVQDYWKAIFDTATSINPDAVVEICPCGTSYAFHNTPYMNQTVASDPLTSWQIRHKGKTLKALTGDNAPYYADHVELSDEAGDFATAIGIGAVVGTKFTWPNDKHPEKGYILTPEKEAKWSKWINIYNEKMLPKGTYKGELYDIGFDVPETHAIEKDGILYYAFYSDDAEQWSGSVEFRGLREGRYKLLNYIDGSEFGRISGDSNTLEISFTEYLLLSAHPIDE